MVEFGTSAFRGWVRVRVLGYGFGVRGRAVKCTVGCSRVVRVRVKCLQYSVQVRVGAWR